jgi:hypothetical protein
MSTVFQSRKIIWDHKLSLQIFLHAIRGQLRHYLTLLRWPSIESGATGSHHGRCTHHAPAFFSPRIFFAVTSHHLFEAAWPNGIAVRQIFRRVVHKSTDGILKSIPEHVHPVGYAFLYVWW